MKQQFEPINGDGSRNRQLVAKLSNERPLTFICRTYLKAKAKDEGWDGSSVDSWSEEIWSDPVQADSHSCGVLVCMVMCA